MKQHMKKNVWLRRSTGVMVSAGCVLSAAASAHANPTVEMQTGVLLVKQSLDGKVGRETGAGVMMSALTQLTNNKILVTWMDSDVPRIDSGWQGKVAVIQINQKSAPSIVVPPTQITAFQGERPFNHPQVATDASGKYAVINFASTKDQGDNTRQYAMVVDENGKVVVDATQFGRNDGNTGAASIQYAGKDANGNSRFIAGYQHNNNESLVAGLVLDTSGATPTLTQTYDKEFYRPTNIGRPEIAIVDADTATVCTEVGNNRPDEYGIGCAVINTNDGTILTGGGGDAVGKDVHNGIVVASHPDQAPKIYMNQATIAPLGNGQCALGVVQSNGAGRNNNRGGTNVSLLYQVDCKTLKVLSQTMPTMGVAPFQRHAALITSQYGNQGQTFVGHLGCSSTGGGAAAIQMVGVDQVKGIQMLDSTARQSQLLPVSWSCDSAWLSNKGLRNPNDQGRDFIRAISGVANPGYQVPGGWMPEASSFLVTSVPFVRGQANGGGGGGGDGGGAKYTNDGGTELQRNSLHLSFLPVAWDPKVQVVMSASVDANQVSPGYSKCVTDCGNAADPSNPYSPNNPNYTGHQTFGVNDNAGGCDVAPGGAGGGAAAGAFALIGLAGLAFMAASRRRNSGRS